jgi:predicted metal-dependent phosphoesterase TrpH
MRRSLGPLLRELHAHTRWSDGALTVAELVDLHGRSGFDGLCVTDHQRPVADRLIRDLQVTASGVTGVRAVDRVTLTAVDRRAWTACHRTTESHHS